MAQPERTEGTGLDDVANPTPKEMAEALARLGKAGRSPAQRPSFDGPGSDDTAGTGSGGSSPVAS